MHAGRHEQAARATHYQQALDPSGLHRIDDLRRLGLQEPHGADDGIVARQGGGQGSAVGHIYIACCHAGAVRQAAGLAGEGGHGVAAAQCFVGQAGAHVAGGADDGDLHGCCPFVVAI
ncbi:hypothetical protein D3C72_1085700 [compost metagenome]